MSREKRKLTQATSASARPRLYDQEAAARRTSRAVRGAFDQDAAGRRPAQTGVPSAPKNIYDRSRPMRTYGGDIRPEVENISSRGRPTRVSQGGDAGSVTTAVQKRPRKGREGSAPNPKLPKQRSARNPRRDRPLTAAQLEAQEEAAEAERARHTAGPEGVCARRRRAHRRRITLFAVLVILVLGVYFSVTVIFKISQIRVTGTSVYSEAVIVDAFRYHVGDNLLTFNASAAADEIVEKLPYLASVQIHRLLPGTVSIEVAPSTEAYAFVLDGGLAVTDAGFKVLRTDGTADGLLSVRGAQLGVPEVGKTLAFSAPEQQQALEALGASLQNGALADVTELDIGDVYNLSLGCGGRFTVRLGSTVGLDYKLQLSAKVMERQSETARGVIDASGAYTSRSATYLPQSAG